MGSLSPRLRHRVTISRPVEARDESGEVVTSWAMVVDNLPAEIVPLSGREFIAAAAVQSEVTARITIRIMPGIDSTMRIAHDDRIYNIVAVLRDPSLSRWLTLMCKEGVNDG
jgi:SPP1 family predicted phage head-tail adaptor